MIPIGPRPVLWHVMKYYAHFGFTDFVLCLGYKAEAIKQFFLTYNEAMANDFVLSNGGADVHLLKTDIHDWNITFVDTGLHASDRRAPAGRSPPAARRRALPGQLRGHADRRGPAGDDRARQGRAGDGELPRGAPELQLPRGLDGTTTAASRQIRDVTGSDIWINGGYFVLRREFLDDMRARRGPRRGAVPAAHRPESCSRSATRASGRRWTRSRTSSGSRPARERQRPVAGLGAGPPRRPRASSRLAADAAAADRRAPGGAGARARDRRPSRRHRDRLRGHDPEADRGGPASPRSAGSC